MALANYSDLKTGIQNWMARTDSVFTNRLDDFIDLAEDRIHYGGDDKYPSEPLRIMGMETTSNLSLSSSTVAVPTGWLESIRLYLNTSPKHPVKFLPPSRFYDSTGAVQSTTGKPSIYTMEGTNFEFAPAPDATYTGKLSYFKKLDALSDATTTNWLITNSPATYLYACMLEANIWAMDDESAMKYYTLFAGRIAGLIRQDKKARTSGSDLRAVADNYDGVSGVTKYVAI